MTTFYIILICLLAWIIPGAFLLWFTPIVNRYGGTDSFEDTFLPAAIPIINILFCFESVGEYIYLRFNFKRLYESLKEGFNLRSKP